MTVGLISIPYAYLLMVNRVVDHVEVGVWALAVVFVLAFINKDDFLNKKQTKSFLQVIGLVCLASLIISGTYVAFDKISRKAKPTDGSVDEWIAFREYAKNHPDDAFLLPFGRYKEFASHIDYAVPPGSWSNVFSTGYWNIHLPPMERELQKRGISNIIKDITHENVYVVADESALSLAPYHFDHYHQHLVIDTVESFGNVKLLKYRIGENEDEKAQH